MKKVCLFLLVNVLICSSGWAADGGQIFKSLRCSGCHSISSSSGMVPSLEVIADSYGDGKSQLQNFLQGKEPARVDPDNAEMMAPYIDTTKRLPEQEIQALVDYIMSHRDRAGRKK